MISLVCRLMNEMMLFYESGNLVSESLGWTPNVNDRCAVISTEDHVWHRAVVLDILPDSKFKV